MAVISVGHHPELTKDEILQVFKKHFGGRYELEMHPRPGDTYELEMQPRFGDFTIKKSSWTAVWIRVEQDRTRTKFVIRDYTPSYARRFVPFESLFTWVPKIALMNEVKSFIRKAPEFR